MSMRVVISGTHASGKSTLISDLAARGSGWGVLGDPYDERDGDIAVLGAAVFVEQFEIAEMRLLELVPGDWVVAERGPLDFLAYLEALTELGRSAGAGLTARRLWPRAAAAMAHVDLLVLLRLDTAHEIWVDADEDRALRDAMDERLGDLVDEADLMGDVPVIEVAGTPASRLAQVIAAVDARVIGRG